MIQRSAIVSLGVLALAVSLFSQPAEANSRFQVQNDSSVKVLINIFNGGDSVCMAEAKHHTVDPGGEKGMGCEGDGKNRCKARVSYRSDGKWVQTCLNINNGCGDNALILDNHDKLVVTGDANGTSCKVHSD